MAAKLNSMWRTLKRIWQLWMFYAKLDLLLLISDVRLALIYFSSELLTSIGSVIGLLLLAQRFDGIGTWTLNHLYVLLGYSTLVLGILNTFFNYNLSLISRRIGRGQLDHVLVQPQPLWMIFITEGFAPLSGLMGLIPGILLFAWGLIGLGVSLNLGWWALLVLNLFASGTIMMSFNYIWGSLAFVAPRSSEEISSSASRLLDQLKVYPLDGLGGILLGSLMTVAPVGLVAWYPVRALLGLNSSAWSIWITPLAALFMLGIALFCFLKGLGYYATTGSQRYSSLGHRS